MTVQAASDAHIILSSSPILDNPSVEIILGANGNTKSFIRENGVECAQTYCSSAATNIIAPQVFRNFSITWMSEPKLFVMRTDIGTQLLTMTRAFLFDIKYFGVKTT